MLQRMGCSREGWVKGLRVCIVMMNTLTLIELTVLFTHGVDAMQWVMM